MPRQTTERSRCTACGGHEAPGLYHPHAFCVLVQHYNGDVGSARLSIDAVLNYGRRLERLGLPNDSRIGTVHQTEEAAARVKKATPLPPKPRRKR